MDFASVRIITDDLDKVVGFYEQVTGVSAVRPAPVFASLRLPSANIDFGHAQTAQLFKDAAHPADKMVCSTNGWKSGTRSDGGASPTCSTPVRLAAARA